jgi:endonuclease/exonuclease/phosphatase family metal-dependent hydrolase
MRVLTYNIQVGITSKRSRDYIMHGWKHLLPYPGRMRNLNAIGGFLEGFDVVGLQELDAGSLRSAYVDQAEYLALRGGFPYWASRTNRNLGHFARHSHGMLARMKPVEVLEHRLPSKIPGRGALELVFGDKQQSLGVISAHLSLSRRARANQLAFLGDLVLAHQHVVVLGDFNCSAESPEICELLTRTHLRPPLSSEPTYPSWKPARDFDQILVSEQLKPVDSQVHPLPYSDHLPVSVELALPDALAEALKPDWPPRNRTPEEASSNAGNGVSVD